MKTKTDSPSKIRGGAKFRKQWEGFAKMVDGASLILLVWMLSEIKKQLKQRIKGGKVKVLTVRKAR